MLKITHTSVFVDDQEKARKFYTGVLGFAEKHNIDLGEFRWLTVTSADDVGGVELVLEPNNNPAARDYQKAIFDQGIPATMFGVANVQTEYERLKALDVKFIKEPTEMGDVIMAIFDDTCGNFLQIVQS